MDSNEARSDVGSRLRALRREKRLTQKGVAKLLDVSHQTICAIERWPAERRLPPTAARYAAVFGLELTESVTYTLVPVSKPALRRSPRRGRS